MIKRLTVVLVLGGCAMTAAAADAPALAGNAQRCEALAGTHFGTGVIEKSANVAAGDQLLSLFMRTLIRLAAPYLPRPTAPAEFCRVTVRLSAAPGSDITAEAWLPSRWNGKLVANGGNGFNGGLGVGPFIMVQPLEQGYASIVTNAGHDDTESAQFAHDSKEQFLDYAYRANHVAAAFAKELVASYYKAPARRAYFQGCSNGGRDGLMEARRFPDDYDGIVAGAPAAPWTRLMTSFAWNNQVIAREPRAQDLDKKLGLIQSAVLKKCDALDGVQDGLLENPLNCRFDPAELQCKDGDRADCLNAGEVAVLRKIYAGPRLSDGTQVFPGMPVGGEGLADNWDKMIVAKKKPQQGQFAVETLRWMVFANPDWELSSFNIDTDYRKAKEKMSATMDSDDPDLGAFMAKGGKLILYHGWSDGLIPATSTLEYYAALRKSMGAVADQNARLFMVPGMMHCTGGVGPNAFDALGALDRWVESRKAPESIVATQYDPPFYLARNPEAKAVRTRPLCPWPQVAQYRGTGSTDAAANFTCK